MLTKSSFRTLALLIAGALLAFLSPSANAQFGMGGMGMGGMQQDVITKRGVEAYAKILGLDKDQHEVAMTLLEGNTTEYAAARKKFDEGMKDIQSKVSDTQDFTLYQKEMPKLAKDFGEKSKALEKSFFEDLKAACNDAQLSKWSKVERYHRRETGLRFAFVSGSAIDLITLTQRTKAQPDGEIQSLLDQYELEMDKNLVTLEKMGKEAQDDYFKGEGNMFDMSRVENVLKKFYDVGKDMRELNREYARKLSQVMDAPSKQRFDDEMKRRTFPRVYKAPHVLKQLETAGALPELDKAQKESIANIKGSYVRDAAGANEKWAKAVEAREDKAGGTILAMMKSMQRMQGQGGADDLNKDVNEARTARKELDSKAEKQLLALLTEDQKSKLPEAPREDSNPWADFMPQPDE